MMSVEGVLRERNGVLFVLAFKKTAVESLIYCNTGNSEKSGEDGTAGQNFAKVGSLQETCRLNEVFPPEMEYIGDTSSRSKAWRC